MASGAIGVSNEPVAGRGGRIRRAVPQPDYPLTYLQREIWFHSQLNGETPLHRSGIAVTIRGALDRHRLVAAVQAVVDRQAVLRTAFRRVGSGPRQVIAPALKADVYSEDLSEHDRTERLRRLIERFQQIEAEPLDLGRPPLWRAALMRFADREHILAFFFHHLIVDVYHAGAILAEIGTTYARLTRGEPPLPPPALEYRDYAVWLDERGRDGRPGEHDDYWLSQLRASRADPLIPRDRLAPPNRRFVVDGLFRALDDALVDELTRLARRCRVTPYGLLIGVFALLLHRVTGAREVFIGQPFSVRPPELQDVAGMYASPLPIRIDVDPRQSFRAFVGAVRRQLDEARQRRDVALMDAFRRMWHAGVEARVAPLRVSVSQMGAVDLQFPDFQMVQTPSVFGATHPYDLWLGVRDLSPGITLTFGYASELFERDSIARLVANFTTLLRDAVGDPDRRLGDLGMLGDGELEAVIGFASAADDSTRDLAVADAVADHAHRTPDAPAISWNGTVLTYAEHEARATALAHRLRAHGVGPGVRVPVLADPRPARAIGMLAVLKAGGVYAPLDPAAPPLRLRRLLAVAGGPVVLAERRFGDALRDAGAAVPVIDLDEELETSRVDGNLPTAAPDAAAALIWASRGSAAPAAIAVPHRALTRMAAAARRLGIGPGDVALDWTPAGDAGLATTCGILSAGARLVLPAPTDGDDAAALADVLRRERVNVLVLSSARFNQAVQTIPEILADVATIVVHGEPLSAARVRRARAALAATRVVSSFGPAEQGGCSTSQPLDDPGEHAAAIRVGRPHAGASVYVLDDQLRPAPIKVKGEVYVGGELLALGYADDPRATAERFVPSPFAAGERLYRTGDWGRWHPDGTLEWLGRRDRRVAVDGAQLDPREIESVLLEHAGVHGCAVVPDAGAAGTRFVAYVVAAAADAEAIAAHAAARLTPALRPTRCVLVDALPRTEAGAIDLEAVVARPNDAPVDCDADVERHVSNAWREVLGLPDVDDDDNFFEIGGDSLGCVRIAARLRAVGLPLRERDLFEHQTVAAQAACLRARLRRADALPPPTSAAPAAPTLDDDELALVLAGEDEG